MIDRKRIMMRRTIIVAVALALIATLTGTTAANASGASMTDSERRAYGQKLHGEVEDVPLLESVAVASGASSTTSQLASVATPAVEWPSDGVATVPADQLARGAKARPGGLAVKVGPSKAKSAEAPRGGVRVHVHSHTVATDAGVDGVLVSVDPETGSDDGAVSVALDYSTFANANGGDWSSRLRLVSMPACALTTPEAAACREQTPVASSTNDVATQTLSATIMAADATVLAASAAPAGPTGSWSATPLSASSTWQVSAQTGDFTWSYPLAVPPTQGGPAPELALSYDAGSLDGKVSTTNNQSSWIGDGWNLEPGYIERRYVSCSDDATGNANNVGHKTGDLCWKTDNATLVFGGQSGDLVKDASSPNTWRLKNDDGTIVKHLTDGWNSDNDTEYWEVITTDGTQYYFGRDKRSASDTLALNSAWTVPVFGNNSGEPCNATTFAASYCNQAWRWNLDYVLDPSGNSMTYVYAKETNSYGRNGNTAVSSYVRGGYLTRIDYGQRGGSETATPAPQQVLFTTAERCLPGTITCDPAQLTSANAKYWPDVPFDLICTSTTTCAAQASPSFFTRKRLTTVTTQVYVSSAYKKVDTWALTQKFPDPGDGSNPVLWLDSIKHSGSDGVALPPVTFAGVQLTNRVDPSTGLGPAMMRYRISSFTGETGAITSVNYTPQDCTKSDLPADADSNTRRCFPVIWDPQGSVGLTTEYFNKYLVDSVVQDPRDGQSLSVETHYSYVGDAKWHYDDNNLVPAAQRTWGDFRGYGVVDVVTGAAGSRQLKTRYRYFRGMDGDHLSSGTRTAAVDGISDVNRANGFLREEIVYDGSSIVTDTRNTPWISGATATDADGVKATLLGTGTAETHTTAPSLAAGERVTKTVTTFDPTYGVPTQVDDQGDIATSSDDRCTRLSYAQNPALNIVTTIARTETVGVSCATTPGRPADVVADTRTFYDGSATLGAAPTKGLPTTVQSLASYTGSTASYVTTTKTAYDALGRPTSSTDALNRTTTTVYTPETGGPVTGTTTTSPDPDGSGAATALVTTTTVDPGRGLPLKVTDPAGKTTTATYDGFGRRTAVWLPTRATTLSASTTYAYTVNVAGISTVTTKTLGQDGTYLASVALYDALGRQRQTQSLGANASTAARLVTDTIFDSRGLAVTQNDAWATTGAPATTLVQPKTAVPSRTLYTYDGAGRATIADYQVDQQARWRTTTTYLGDRTTVVPPSGGTPTTTITDARGSTIELDQYTTASTSGPSQKTTYAYDDAGRLTSMHDPANNEWTYKYDLRGRMIESKDPDKGKTTTTYDDAGQVVTTTDARNTTLWYGYDKLGRKVAERVNSSTGALQAAWVFDTVAKGQLSSSTRYDANANAYVTAITSYDDAYQPKKQTVTLPASEGALAGTYTTTYAYTLDEQLKSVAYPKVGGLPAETVTTVYDALSQPSWMTGGGAGGVYVAASTLSSYGDVLALDLGNSYSEYVSYTYEEGTRRLSTIALSRDGITGDDVHAGYTYDNAGNVTSIADVPTVAGAQSDTQCFTYDGLRRLTSAWTPASGSCAASPSVAGLGGPAAYWTDYAYNAVGDRSSVVSHKAAGNTTATYTYPAPAADHPHAVSQVQTTAPGGSATTASYGYDASGNTTSRPGSSGQQSLTWDVEGHLATDTDGGSVSSYVYDADGNRLSRHQGTTITAYLPSGQELTLDSSTGTVTGTRYYQFDGRTIAVRTGPGLAGVSSLVSDQHDTAIASVADTTNALTVRRLDAFGNTRGTAPTWPGNHGFLNAPNDSTALTHIGAREYDPSLGRFISVDPLLDLGDPQQWAGYAYCNNNPTSFSDPTGLDLTPDNWTLTHPTSTASPSAATKPESFGAKIHRATTSQWFKAVFAGHIASADLIVGAVKSLPQQTNSAIANRFALDYVENGGGWSGFYNAAVMDFDPMYGAVAAAFSANDAAHDGRYGDAAVAACTAADITALTAASIDSGFKFGKSAGAPVIAARSPLADATVVSGRFPRTAAAGETLVRRGADGGVTHYQVYGEDGLPIKRVDVTGSSHGGVPTPHVVEFERHVNPITGETFVRPGSGVRPATPEELDGLD